jgi:hypothetical protein
VSFILTAGSQAFYREKVYQTHLGYKDLEDFMQNFWEAWGLSKGLLPSHIHFPSFLLSPVQIRDTNHLSSITDPENLLTMLYTWQAGDCSNQEPYNGDFKAAMQAIKAKTLVLPCKTDLYFPYVYPPSLLLLLPILTFFFTFRTISPLLRNKLTNKQPRRLRNRSSKYERGNRQMRSLSQYLGTLGRRTR